MTFCRYGCYWDCEHRHEPRRFDTTMDGQPVTFVERSFWSAGIDRDGRVSITDIDYSPGIDYRGPLRTVVIPPFTATGTPRPVHDRMSDEPPPAR